jgi:penicillin amidase
LRATVGDPAFWEWGRIHTVTFQEQTLGTSGIGPLEWIFNKGPFAAPGSCTTINKICGSISVDWPPEGDTGNLTARFAAGSGPSYRLVVDMANLDGATILPTTGESGVPFDAHYDDFISRWLENSPMPLNWTSGAVDGAATQTLLLQP